MRCGCLVGADCTQGGEDTACDDDEQQDCCEGDCPGAAAAVFFVFVIFVDAGGFGVCGDGCAVGCVPVLGGGDALLVGAGSRDLLIGVGGAAAFGVAEDFGAQCVFCVGECVVFDQQGVQQGVGAGVGGDEVAAAFGGDAQVEDLDVAACVGCERAGVCFQQCAAAGRCDDDRDLTVENLVGAFKHHVGFCRNDDVCGDLVAASEDRSDRNLLRQRVLPRWFHSACRVAGPDY